MPETENSTETVRRGRGRPRGAGRPKKVRQEWKNTRAALEKLDNLLKCKLCANQLKEPHYVGSCEHTFCKSCVEEYSGKHCPECNVPVLARELQRDVTISNVINYSSQLKNVINQDETTSNKDNYESSSDDSLSPITTRRNGLQEESKNENTKMEVDDNDKNAAASSPSSTRSKRRSGLRATHSSPPPKHVEISDPHKPNTLRLKRNIKGETPLHLAAIKGDVVTIRRLLHQGANPNEKDNAGWTPLHEACHHGHITIVEILLDGGAFIDIPACDNETPLHDAVSMGKIDIVTLLVSRGANINARNSAGITPLDMSKTEEMKEALNTPVNLPSSGQSTKSVSLVPKIEDIILLKTGLNQEQEEELLNCAEILNATIVEKFTDDVTHLICVCDERGHCQRTMKFLQAILTGKWILNYTWVEECIAFRRRVFEEPFEVIGNKVNPLSTYGPKRSRLNAVQQFPPLFDGCYFYLHGTFQFPSPNRENLITLIKLGGGVILNREPRPATATTINIVPYHAIKDENGFISPANQFIVYQDIIPPRLKSNCDKYIRCVTFGWLLNCITSYQLLPPN